MKTKQAIKELEERLLIDDYKEQIPEYYGAIEAAIEALEKQIPKEPIHKDGEIICPNCLGALIYCWHSFKGNYCEECGQAIDWSGEE